jgi:predicted DNA-binding transcriptional regulator AlpA
MPRSTASQEVFLTVREIAARHRQSAKTIYNKMAAGTLGIPVVRLPGGDPRFRLSDVEQAERGWTKDEPKAPA